MTKLKRLWTGAPSVDDLRAAERYLSLLTPPAAARRLVARLRRARTVAAVAKDLLRASNLSLLPRDEAHVQEDLKRIHKHKALSPVLLIRGDLSAGTSLVVADGYHRICAICYYDEDAPVACRIVG